MPQKKLFFTKISLKIAVGGLIKAIDTITFGSPIKISSKVEEVIKTCARGGKYIHAPEYSLPAAVPLKNVDSFIFSAKRIGRIQ